MLTRNIILTALFVLATGALAADKPAVQAREQMEAEARGYTTATATRTGGTIVTANAATKPAVAFRLAKEAPAAAEPAIAAGNAETHPVANVGYGVVAQPVASGYMVQPIRANEAAKPAVQYRLAREQR